MTTRVELDLYSPGWGHTDSYNITLEANTFDSFHFSRGGMHTKYRTK